MKYHITKIIELRQDRDFTQKEIGAIINKSQQGYAHIENEHSKLDIEDLKQLCMFYQVSADYILGLPEGLSYPKR